jgi:hypothetical protein
MSLIVLLTFAVCAAFVAVLCAYLWWVSSLLMSIANGLDDIDGMVRDVIGHANTIVPDLQHTNRTLGTISSALPLLYGLAEKINHKAAYGPEAGGVAGPAEVPRRRGVGR